jgi:cyclopropane fatty-acyl-phospholipid synthase-like methyltransferase
MKSSDVVEIYNTDYYLNKVDGWENFSSFDGKYESLFPRFKRNIELLDLRPSHRFLEIGCGRGEICIYHSLRGGFSKGVDYSEDAIALAKNKSKELGAESVFVTSSFCDLNEPNNYYDRILASEFIEHISRDEGEEFFRLAYSWLKPGGKILVFTWPNNLYRKYGYRFIRFYGFLRGNKLPSVMPDTMHEHYKLYHINEQNFFTLKRMAEISGFKKILVNYDVYNDNFVKKIVFKTPLRHILFNNLYLIAEK